MAYNIEDIEGIGEVYAEKLRSVDIRTTEELLRSCSTPAGRKLLSETTGISGKLILTWTNHADLMRIKGVAGQFAELLEAAGVDTVAELAHRRADNRHAALEKTNEARHLCGRVPAVAEIEKMIAQAKELPRAVEY